MGSRVGLGPLGNTMLQIPAAALSNPLINGVTHSPGNTMDGIFGAIDPGGGAHSSARVPHVDIPDIRTLGNLELIPALPVPGAGQAPTMVPVANAVGTPIGSVFNRPDTPGASTPSWLTGGVPVRQELPNGESAATTQGGPASRSRTSTGALQTIGNTPGSVPVPQVATSGGEGRQAAPAGSATAPRKQGNALGRDVGLLQWLATESGRGTGLGTGPARVAAAAAADGGPEARPDVRRPVVKQGSSTADGHTNPATSTAHATSVKSGAEQPNLTVAESSGQIPAASHSGHAADESVAAEGKSQQADPHWLSREGMVRGGDGVRFPLNTSWKNALDVLPAAVPVTLGDFLIGAPRAVLADTMHLWSEGARGETGFGRTLTADQGAPTVHRLAEGREAGGTLGRRPAGRAAEARRGPLTWPFPAAPKLEGRSFGRSGGDRDGGTAGGRRARLAG